MAVNFSSYWNYSLFTKMKPQEDNIIIETESPKPPKKRGGGNFLFAAFLLFLGAILLLNNFELLPWDVWSNIWRLWPVALIFLGFQILFSKSWLTHLLIILITASVVLFLLFINDTSSINFNNLKNLIPIQK